MLPTAGKPVRRAARTLIVRPMRLAVVVSFVVAVLTFGLSSGAGASTAGSFVALGDSYAAGPLVPTQIAGAGLCLRSDHNYAHVLKPVVAATRFADVSCSGATTYEMTHPQHLTVGSNAAQFNALTADTKVVTLEIGGNDIGFTSILLNCASVLPWGSPCKNKYVKNGDDKIADAINATGPKIGGVIDGIHTRAPQAAIYVLGYPAILPDTGGGCWPKLPITASDTSYLRAKEKQLNAAVASAASGHHAHYVDVYTPSIGKDACSSSTTRWIEPVVPLHLAAPVHPNATGEKGMAAVVQKAMGL
jgi:hypothetical protein